MLSIFTIILFATFIQATPLLFTALGGMINERGGVVNIGLEGIMTLGAFTGATSIILIERFTSGIPGIVILILGLVSAIVVGILVGLLYALFTVSLKIDQTIIGVALNIIGLGIAGYLVKVLFETANTPNIQTHRITFLNGEIYLISIIALLCVFLTWFIFKKSVWGKYVDAVGENPQAADAMGLNVVKIRYQAVVVSSIFASIGGASIVLTITGNFSPVTVSGLGFIALAVMLFGNRRPFGILFASLIFGLFKSASTVIVTIFTDLPFDDVYLQILPYVLTIVVLVLFSKSATNPSALGKAYDKEVR